MAQELKVIKELSSGSIGTTYIGRLGGEKVLIKMAHIHDTELSKHPNTIDITFLFNNFAIKHPEHFMILISNTVIIDGAFKHKKPEWMKKRPKDDSVHEWYRKVHDTNKCLQTVYTPLLDGTLAYWFDTLNAGDTNSIIASKPHIYSFYIQYVYMHQLMAKDGWYHPDAHPRNVMYKKTDKATIYIHGRYKLPTYNKIWYMIDYDEMYNTNFVDYKDIAPLQKISENKHMWLAHMLVNTLTQPWWTLVKSKDIKVASFDKVVKYIKTKSPTSNLIDLLPDIDEPITSSWCLYGLCLLHKPEYLYKYMGLKDPVWDKYITQTKAENNIYIADYTYVIKHINSHTKIIKKLIGDLSC